MIVFTKPNSNLIEVSENRTHYLIITDLRTKFAKHYRLMMCPSQLSLRYGEPSENRTD